MAVALDILVNPPSQPYKYGLLSAATVFNDPAFTPRGGDYTWRVQGCTPGAQWDYCWTPGADGQAPKSVEPDAWDSASPFVVYDGVRCNAVGEPDLKSVATARLSLSEQGQAERHLWQQMADAAAADPDAVIADAGAPFSTVAQAVAALEAQTAATTGAIGVIHMPRYAIAGLDDCLITRDGRTLRTLLGTPVAAGGGYNYAGPDGTVTDDVLWIYATGPTFVYRGPVIVPDQNAAYFDKASNQILYIAERPYLTYFDCPIYAAAVSVEGRPDTVWPDVTPRFAMTVDDSDPLNVTATFANASCDEVRLSWGDGSDVVGVPVTDGTGSAAHNYETGTDPVSRTRSKRATTAPNSSKKKGR